MKKNSIKKLDLQRETLVPLQANDLGDVNGGTGGVIKAVTKYLCTTVTTLQSQPIITCRGN